MRNCKKLSYTDKIKWRASGYFVDGLAACWFYMVTVVNPRRDSAIMTGLAKQFR